MTWKDDTVKAFARTPAEEPLNIDRASKRRTNRKAEELAKIVSTKRGKRS